MLNRIILMGRLARDPELRHTQAGIAVASFRLAVDRDIRNKETGERATDWIDVVAWRNTAEFAAKYLAKGRLVVVEGRLQIRDWTDREGNKRTSAEVVTDNIYFAESRRDTESGGAYSRPAAPPPAVDYGMPPAGGDQFSELTDDDDGELPF